MREDRDETLAAIKSRRESQGVPQDPSGYEVPDNEAAQVMLADSPLLPDIQKAFHEANLPQSFAARIMGVCPHKSSAFNGRLDPGSVRPNTCCRHGRMIICWPFNGTRTAGTRSIFL